MHSYVFLRVRCIHNNAINNCRLLVHCSPSVYSDVNKIEQSPKGHGKKREDRNEPELGTVIF